MSMKVEENALLYVLDKAYKIRKIVDFNSVLAEDVLTGETKIVDIVHLRSRPVSDQPAEKFMDLSAIPEEKMREAENRLEAIKPLLNVKSRRVVERRAKELGLSPTTLYNWLRDFESTGKLSSLVHMGSDGGRGQSRLNPDQETIIKNVLNEYYLAPLKPSKKKTWETIALQCQNAGLDVPSISSVSRRIDKLNEKDVVGRREGKKKAEKFEPIEGEFPDAVKPMHVLQIDHTQVDVMLVDDIYRIELGRPWITLAIDVYSRMIAGFYVSFESPGYLAVGQTIANAVLRKDAIIEKYGLKTDWPVWGKAQIIHADNAKEFRGTGLERVCKEYGMDLAWRPTGKTRYGGHIERMMRTLNEDIHVLRGTTFSNIFEKGEYDSQAEAVMTLDEFEKWLSILIVDKYHNTVHTALGKTPLKRYEEGIFGSSDTPPRGLPPIIEDEYRFRLNMLPYEERTIQRYGVQIDNINYHSNVLNYWIGAYEPNVRPRRKRKFTIRRDPRDLSKVYFYDPETGDYYEIPYATMDANVSVSLWEWRAAKKYLKSIENREYDEREIFDALQRMREIEEEASKKTKKQRKNIQRRVQLAKVSGGPEPREPQILEKDKVYSDDDAADELEPYDGIEDDVDEMEDSLNEQPAANNESLF